MATKTIKVSDLTGEEIGGEENLARLVVEEYPDLPDPVTLEVLPEEIEGKLPEEANFVSVTYYPPTTGDGNPQRYLMPVEDFNNLAEAEDMGTVLRNAYRAQQEAERPRGRRGRRQRGERRQRIDYASPEYAGLPHRGRITDAEKEYVRNNLEEVNTRRVQAGHDPIDPADPVQAEKYGL